MSDIYITDSCYKRYLLQYKVDNKKDFKVLTKSELYDALFFEYKRDDERLPFNPIPQLLKTGRYDYSAATKLKRILQIGCFDPQVDDPEKMSEIKEELRSLRTSLHSASAIEHDELSEYELKHSDLYLFECDGDQELLSALKRENMLSDPEEHLIHFSDLGESSERGPRSLIFSDKIEQFSYIFADIRKKVITERWDPSDIAILVQSEADYYYCELFSDLFDITIEKTTSTPLSSIPSVKEFIRKTMEKQKIEIDESTRDENLKTVFDLIKKYDLIQSSRDDFSSAFISLQEILGSHVIRENENTNGVKILTDVIFDKHLLFYVTDYNSDVFYHICDDDDVFPDDVLKSLGLNPSYTLSKLDRKKKLNFLLHNNIALVSRVRFHLNDKIYDSPFVKDKECASWPKPEMARINSDGLYTTKASQFLQSLELDMQHASPCFRPFYRDYEHRSSNIDVLDERIEFSPSKLETYGECPFKYLLDQMVRDPIEDDYATRFGRFIHEIAENAYEAKFDYDEVFEKAKVEEFKSTSEKEEVFIDVVRPKLQEFIDQLRDSLNMGGITERMSEHELSLSLHSDDSGRDYTIKGRADEILISRSESSLFYYTILDFKTGHPDTFEYEFVPHGASLQLPLYKSAYEREFQDEGYDYRFGGIGIVHPYSKKNVEKGKIAGTIAMSGVVTSEEGYKDSIGKKGFFKKSKKREKQAPDPERLVEDAETISIRFMDDINRGDFPIEPKMLKKDTHSLPCTYCSYKDICYHNSNDIVSYLDVIAEDSQETGEENQNGKVQ